MTVGEFLTHTSYALRGGDEDAPTFGGDESTQWLYTLNRKINELYSTSKVLFDATYHNTAPVEVGTVAVAGTTTLTGTGTKFTDYRVGDTLLVSGQTVRTITAIASDTSLTVGVAFSGTSSELTFSRSIIIDDGVSEYSLHRRFIAPANQAQILKTDSTYTYIDFASAREQNTTTRKVSVAGINPKVLTFSTAITSTEDIVGGTLSVPGFYMPTDLTDEDEELPLPDPYWGVLAVAAEVATNDITYEDKAEGLQVKANDLYMKMVRNNRRGTYGNPKKGVNAGYRIRNTEIR